MNKEIPYIVYECTRTCNLDCKYCYNIWKSSKQESKTDDSKDKKPLATLKKLFSQCRVEHIAFSGGEPFLCKSIFELCLYTRLKKTETYVITNGTVGEKADYSYLNKIGVDLFELPFHSHDPIVHDKLVQKVGAHKKVIESIKFLNEINANLVVVIVITKSNIKDLEPTLRKLKDLGVEQVMLNRYNIGGNGFSYEEDLIPSLPNLKKSFELANKLSVELDMIITSNVCTPFCILNPSEYSDIQFTHCSNDPFEKPITLETNGDLRLCNHSPIVIGNIYNNNILDILYNYKAKLKNRTTPELCSKCESYAKCNGGCIGSAEQVGDKKRYDAIIDKYIEKRELSKEQMQM